MVDVKRKHHPPAEGHRSASAASAGHHRAAKPAGDAPKPDSFATNAVTNSPSGAASGPPKIDISDDAKLKQLQAGSPDDKKLASEIVNARKSYKPLLDAGAKITLTTSAGNGNAPVLTVIPKALQDNPHQQFKRRRTLLGQVRHRRQPRPQLERGDQDGGADERPAADGVRAARATELQRRAPALRPGRVLAELEQRDEPARDPPMMR